LLGRHGRRSISFRLARRRDDRPALHRRRFQIRQPQAIIGDRENALAWLEEAARRRDDGPLAMRTMWYWQPYKGEARFKAIERRVGMP
jgi:hypothetical protein